MYSNLTPEHVAAFAFANDLTGLFGILTGLIIGGSAKAILNIMIHGFQKPRKIKVVLNNDNFQYFYRFQNKYYSRTDVALQRQNRINNIKSSHVYSSSYLIFLLFLFILLLSLILFLRFSI